MHLHCCSLFLLDNDAKKIEDTKVVIPRTKEEGYIGNILHKTLNIYQLYPNLDAQPIYINRNKYVPLQQ
jgi:hypothetical protein